MEESDLIYADYNATTPLAKEVVSAITEGLCFWGNPSSSHPLSRAAAKQIENARIHLSNLLNVGPDEVIFTSGGTESNNWIIESIVRTFFESGIHGKPHIICSAIEHPSIINKLEDLKNLNIIDLSCCPIEPSSGKIDLNRFRSLISGNTCMVSVMLANNETGVIQPITEIAEILLEFQEENNKKIFFHTDASQALGKMKVDLRALGADALTVVGHKFYGPRIGALVIKQPSKNAFLKPLFFGGNQEAGLRSGTENTPMIIGLGAAAKLAYENVNTYEEHLRSMRDYFELELKSKLNNQHIVNFPHNDRLPNTSSISFINFAGNACELLERCKTFLASTGAACHTGVVSQILTSCGVNYQICSKTVRFSFGRETTKKEIDNIIEELVNVLA